MDSGTTTLDAAAILADAREYRRAANAAEAGLLVKAVEWAHAHTVTDLDDAATWWGAGGGDTGIPIAGEGCPLVSEFAVAEFATALGITQGSGRNLVGQALELFHRLPKLWARVQAGSLAPWRARRIAEDTQTLSLEAARFVDDQVAPFAHRTGVAQTQRLVQTAIARYMPEHAKELREKAADQRYFAIDHHQVSFTGTSRVHGELDLADALDLEDAITAGARQLADLGSTDTLDARRAAAVGVLARGELVLDLGTDRVSTGSTTGSPVSTGSTTARQIVLYVHLSEDALTTGNPDAPVRVENGGGQLLTAAQVAEWCGRPDTTRVVVKPVIDLHQPLATDAYQVPARIAEHVELRDTTCVFPWCHRPARRSDKDHITPYDPGGPPDQTSTQNLACLCRLHHRMKTHAGWTYTMVEPGIYLWHSPMGLTYLRDRGGTTDLTPPPRRTS